MTIPLLTVLGFALWTLLTLIFSVGVFRWAYMLTGRTEPKDFRAGETEGYPDFYRRAVRAHMNCVENLPVYVAIIFVLHSLQLHGLLINVLCVVFIVARICQTLVHLCFVETNRRVGIRFLFFFIQIAIMLWLTALILM